MRCIMIRSFSLSLFALCLLGATLAQAKPPKVVVPVWTDPKKAAAAHPDFKIQGEYSGEIDGKKVGVQVAALDNDEFHVLTYEGGLPGAGWDSSKIKAEKLVRSSAQTLTEDLKKVNRKSDTLGKKAPEDALVLFDGEKSDYIEGTVKDGFFWSGGKTTQPVGDFHMHAEFRLAYKPGRPLSSQDRGNSGLYIFDNYEIQIIDTFGLDFDAANNAIPTESLSTQWCGCFYKFKEPDVPMAFPPLAWQTYDIDFTAPRFKDGEKVANARITVRHNGVVIHDDVEMATGTGAGAKRPEKEKGLIIFQDHGNPVAFRNLWLVEK